MIRESEYRTDGKDISKIDFNKKSRDSYRASDSVESAELKGMDTLKIISRFTPKQKIIAHMVVFASTLGFFYVFAFARFVYNRFLKV